MKANRAIPTLGTLAFVSLLATGPAQACMPFFSGASGDSCPTSQYSTQGNSPQSSACPVPGSGGQAQQGCGLINPELASAMGEMAAGGMRIATHMMQVLAEEVSHYAAASGDSR